MIWTFSIRKKTCVNSTDGMIQWSFWPYVNWQAAILQNVKETNFRTGMISKFVLKLS